MTVEYIPVLVRDRPVLIACPANISIFEQGSIGEYQRIWLVDAKVFDDAREIVNMAFAARAVQPELDQIAVATR